MIGGVFLFSFRYHSFGTSSKDRKFTMAAAASSDSEPMELAPRGGTPGHRIFWCCFPASSPHRKGNGSEGMALKQKKNDHLSRCLRRSPTLASSDLAHVLIPSSVLYSLRLYEFLLDRCCSPFKSKSVAISRRSKTQRDVEDGGASDHYDTDVPDLDYTDSSAATTATAGGIRGRSLGSSESDSSSAIAELWRMVVAVLFLDWLRNVGLRRRPRAITAASSSASGSTTSSPSH